MKKINVKEFLLCFALGIALGLLSKYLDTIASNGSWGTLLLNYFGDLFTRLGIWILLATIIAAYSKTLIKSAMNTFLFFIGMLMSYYLYSAYLFGFFSINYFIFWASIALLSPLLAMIVWVARHNERLAYFLPALPMGLLLSLSLSLGIFYVDVFQIDELLMYLILCIIFYKNRKQMAIIVLLSIVVAFVYAQLTPFHF